MANQELLEIFKVEGNLIFNEVPVIDFRIDILGIRRAVLSLTMYSGDFIL